MASTIYGYTSFKALGVGAFDQAGYDVVQAKVEPEGIPWASGFMMISQPQLGGIVLVLSMIGAIFVNQAKVRLLNLSAEQQSEALAIIVQAIDNVYILSIVAGGLGVVLSVPMVYKAHTPSCLEVGYVSIIIASFLRRVFATELVGKSQFLSFLLVIEHLQSY
ncbi:hypothetical protein BKA67DRAFT_536110 [Truncatella angustata]|uniref:Uncharacterized protein n=1 Tax=Truncatella angustata TaxID=152316 RepID=A0A9P8ZYA9_9PEZI|nr:uncharacterized protein BKA67DRAFT_536110 [Truncatella angustata]KAH6654814.1 hypothetical protein BKA67DRAFT_536110 [Truncatella angustata]